MEHLLQVEERDNGICKVEFKEEEINYIFIAKTGYDIDDNYEVNGEKSTEEEFDKMMQEFYNKEKMQLERYNERNQEPIYGYCFDEEPATTKILHTVELNINYNNQITDLKQVKDEVLNKYKDFRDIQFEGISCIYFNEKNKIFFIKLKKTNDSNTLLACNKDGKNLKIEPLWNFYYTNTTLVSESVMDEKYEEYSEKTGLPSIKRHTWLRDFRTDDDIIYEINRILFKEDTQILLRNLATGCILIRNVENDFLIDNEVYNERSFEEIVEDNKKSSKEDMNCIDIRITFSDPELDGFAFFENNKEISKEFIKELSKISKPEIDFGFEGVYDIKRFKKQLKNINTGEIYDSDNMSDYGDIYNVPLKKGKNSFELTITDEYDNKRIIKNSINL